MISPRRLLRASLFGLALLAMLLLAGCELPAVLRPASPQAQAISDLIVLLLGISVVVFVVVEGLLIVTIIRFREKGAKRETTTVDERAEILWIVLPAITLAVLFFVSVAILRFLTTQDATWRGLSSSSSNQVLNVRIVGHQWWWEIEYPDLEIVTANEMHIPVGVLANLSVESADVIHSFWIPELGGKVDAVPGQTNNLIFSPNTADTYRGQCSEFCGEEHAMMLMRAVAEPKADFDAWVKQQQAPPATMTGEAARGENIFMSGACVGCHAIYGTDAKGTFAPDLTHFASRAAFAGDVFPNTPDNVTKWLTDPQKLKHGNNMPNLNLTPDQVHALAAYLADLK